MGEYMKGSLNKIKSMVRVDKFIQMEMFISEISQEMSIGDKE